MLILAELVAIAAFAELTGIELLAVPPIAAFQAELVGTELNA
jgi:hypothetical protein